MAIIPRYTSRALPEGAQPGLIDGARSRGRAGARLAASAGGAIIAGVEYTNRKDAARAAERAYRTRMLKDMKEAAGGLGDSIEDFEPFGDLDGRPLPDGWTVGFGDATPTGDASAATRTGGGMAMRTGQQKQVRAVLDRQSDETLLGSLETAMTQARAAAQAAAAKPGTPAKDMARLALAQFDRDVAKLSKGIEDRPHLKSRFDALAVSSRAPMELRMLTVENARRAGEEKVVLSESLAGLAQAAAVDPAMAPGATGRGFAQIEAAMKAGMLDPQEAAAMQGAFAENLHISAMRGQIAADPAHVLGKLESGEFDTVFDEPVRKRLTQEAETAARAKGAEAAAAARARRRALELDLAEDLKTLAETGAGDASLEARARAELPPEDFAAFEANQAAARESYATRREYAFMTDAEIEADLEAYAPRDTDERDETRTIRREVADEVLAARADDPAGWAMRDESVKQAIEDAEAALEAAEPGTSEMSVAEREYRRALAARDALQRDMGIAQPRLLTSEQRDGLAEELAALAPLDRIARLRNLRRRYGPRYEALARELSGRVSADTAVLLVHAGDSLLTGALARGMAVDGVEFRGARELTLPMIDGKLDKSRLEDGQLYSFMAGDRIVRVIYDRRTDALVPALVQSFADEALTEHSRELPDPSRPEDTAGEVARKFVENVPAMFKKSAGGLLQAMAESAGPDLNIAKHPIKPGQSYDDWRRERIDAWRAAKGSGQLAQFGADLAARASADLQANAPNVDPESLKGYAYDISSALVQMAPAIAVSVGTKNANLGLAVVGAQVYGDRYGESRAAGRTEREAHADATFYALTEAIPERIPLGILMKQGSKFLPRLTQTMAGEGVQEMFTEVLQAGYDAGLLDEQMTWGEAWDRIKRAGIVGMFVGGGTSAGAHPFVNGESTPESSGAELAPVDTRHAASDKAGAEGDVPDFGSVQPDDPEASVAGTPRDRARRDQYYESALHPSFRGESPEMAGDGQAGDTAFGLIDPASGKPVIQPINDVDRMLAVAEESVAPLGQQLGELASGLPGVEFVGVRAKARERLGEKLESGRRADTIGDYLGGRITVDDPAMLDEAVRALTRRYRNVEVDDFLDSPRDAGYRAIHMQIVLDSGMTAEIQIMPSEILPVYERDHVNYEKWRNKDTFTKEEIAQREADKAWAQQAYAEAYERWQRYKTV